MLNPNDDRLDYGQILAPPVGHTLDFAVGTTYSLDLDALTGACIALGLSEETDSDLMKNPICLLEALRTTGDKVALFCEGGQIHIPNNITSLYILLEKMVYQVNTSKRRGVAKSPSFHPKFWLLRYIDEKKKPLYRVVVLSRNLTFDRSWDVTVCMDGKVKKEESHKTAPIADFLSYLMNFLKIDENSASKRKKMRTLQKELPFVHFDLDMKEFEDFAFLPVGFKKSGGGFYNIEEKEYYPLFHDSFQELLIMSPFLTGSVVKGFNERRSKNAECMLITRSMSLPKLKSQDCSGFKLYMIKDAVFDGESIISEEDEQIQKQDIHAKMYMVRNGSDTYLYLGSLNASHNAINGNIEMMLMLKSKNRYLNLSKLKKSLFCGEEDAPTNPFQEVYLKNNDLQDEEDELKSALDNYIKTIVRMQPAAVVIPNGTAYDINLTFEKYEESRFHVTISPLLSNKTEKFAESVIFTSLALTQLSDFYKVSVSDRTRSVERVLVISTEGLPEDREKAVISSVVDNKEHFYRYIAFLLGDSYVMGALENITAGEGLNKGKQRKTPQIPALYEKMLQTAATYPEKLQEIDYLIKAISGDDVIPEEFIALYDTFKKVVKFDGRH